MAGSRWRWACRKNSAATARATIRSSFSLGWSACFGQAILVLAKKHGVDGQDARVTVTLAMDKDDVSFGFKADIQLSLPGADKAKLQALIEDAHKICPYSRATRGNVPVTLTVA